MNPGINHSMNASFRLKNSSTNLIRMSFKFKVFGFWSYAQAFESAGLRLFLLTVKKVCAPVSGFDGRNRDTQVKMKACVLLRTHTRFDNGSCKLLNTKITAI